ncbi:MAG: hypothetical protein QXI39_09690 [Candidatus Bathyarchaeia archaeon]
MKTFDFYKKEFIITAEVVTLDNIKIITFWEMPVFRKLLTIALKRPLNP